MVWKNFKERVKNIGKSFFLKRKYPTETTFLTLEKLYPEIDWRRVEFYEGLPWFTPLIAPYVSAQALPDFYSFSKYRIYIRIFDESRPQCLADIVHEGFHVLQAMRFFKGYGIGFLRGFMIYYNAVFAKFGYRNNPFEIPAYDQEFRFLGACEKIGLHGISSKVERHDIEKIAEEKDLVFYKDDFKYKESPLLLIVSFIFCVFVTIIRPFADILVFLVSRLLLSHRRTT